MGLVGILIGSLYWFFHSHLTTALLTVRNVHLAPKCMFELQTLVISGLILLLARFYSLIGSVTKNRCVTHVKIRGYANLVSSLLAYLISTVASWFCNSILSRSRMLLQIVCYCNVTLFSIAGKF